MTTLEHELEIALRAETPRPSAEFAERLDAKVAAGFPRKKPSRFRLPAIPAVATGLALIVAVVVVVSVTGNNGNSGSGSVSGAPGSEAAAPAVRQGTPDSSAAGGSATSQAQVAPKALATPSVPPSGVRRVERSAALTLGAPSSKLDDVANGIVGVVDRHHGFVLHSTVTTGSGGSTGGTFILRIPSGSLQDTLSDLSGLADVRSRTQSADDITAPYNATQSQLAEARALRHSLLARLAKATTDTEAEALRNRIHLANAQIRSLTARFTRLQNRARLATIEVTLVRERAHHSAGATGISGDFHDALHSLAVSFGIAVRVLGVALPLALLAALGWCGAAVLKRRRREAALF